MPKFKVRYSGTIRKWVICSPSHGVDLKLSFPSAGDAVSYILDLFQLYKNMRSI